MKNLLLIFILATSQICTIQAGDITMPYSAFGPQAMAYKFIGRAIWQWEQFSDDDQDYPVMVVVYWDTTKEEVTKKYPVDPAQKKDYRYVEIEEARIYLKEKIAEVSGHNEADVSQRKELIATLEKLEIIHPQKKK